MTSCRGERRFLRLVELAFLVLWGLVLPLPGSTETETQFTWMYGLQGLGGLEQALSLGLNTLYLPTSNSAESLESTQRLVRLAQSRGVHVIIALPCYSFSTLSANPDDAAYRTEVGGRMRAVLRFLAGEPGVTAWAVGDYPERELRLPAEGLSEFVARRYGTVEAAKASWGTQFELWKEFTPAASRATDLRLPYGTGRASIDYADFQAEGLRKLLSFWAEQVRGIDAERPLFTGRLALYRSVASVPREYSHIVPEAPVEVLEPDTVAGNVQAVDLARQAGQFRVVPSLRVPVPPQTHYDFGRTLGRWVCEAQLHGAVGVALDGAERIRDSGAPEEVLRTLGPWVKAAAGEFTVEPWPSLCVLYEPYAEGRQAEEVPLYGYLRGLAPGEPSLLAAALRLGSKYGLVDYLTPERLLAANLERYSAVLAPCALSLPREVQGKLRSYVERGGRLVCDLGAGMYETGSWLALPTDLARMCGVTGLGELREQAGDLSFGMRTAMFPSVVPPLSSQGVQPPKARPLPGHREETQGTPLDRKAWTFTGPMALATITSEARAVGIVIAEAKTETQAPRFGGLIAQPYGLGWTAFCTGSLWARWNPADTAFQAVHADLWGARAKWAVKQAGLWPGAVEICSGEDSVWLLNCSGQSLAATVLVRESGWKLQEGAFMWLPSGLATDSAAEMLAYLEPLRVQGFPQRPVRVLPETSGAYAHLTAYTSERISLEIAGPGATVTLGMRQQRRLSSGNLVRVLIKVTGGDYALVPGSQHRVRVSAGFEQRVDTVMTATERGELTIPAAGRRLEVEITPASSGA